MHRSTLRVVAAALLGWTTMASVAAAQPVQVPRVIVLRFAGPRADRAREAVVTELASYVELVSEQQAVEAAQATGIDISTPEGMEQVARNLGVTLVVQGLIERGRDGATTLVVVDPSGEEIARREAPRPRRSADLVAIAQAAVGVIDDAQAALRRREEEAAAAAAAAQAPPPEPAAEAPLAEEEPPREPPEPQAWRQPALLLLAGLRIRSVSTAVTDPTGTRLFFAADPYPEIDVYGLFHPLTDAGDASRGLVLGLQGSFSVGISYAGETGEHGLTSFRVRADVGYGHTFGGVFELAGLVGFGVDGVLLDQNDGFPSTIYSYLRPGVLGRARLAEDLVIAELGVGGRIGLDGGDLAGAFGPGLAFGGVDLFAGLSGMVDGFTWAARFGFTHLALGFDGTGGPFGNGESGEDQTFEGRLLLGYAL